MGFVNLILNIAGLLLWISWRDLAVGSLLNATGTPLVRTLRRAGSARAEGNRYVGILLGLILLRALVNWWLGGAMNWTPRVDLIAVVLPFRSELFIQSLMHAVFSFAVLLGWFYVALLLLSILQHPGDMGPVQKFVRQHLGRVGKWPMVLRIFLPVLVGVVVWPPADWLLAWQDIVPRGIGFGALLKQGALLGVASLLIWKYVLAVILGLHFVNDYVYLGANPFWQYVTQAGRLLLAPLRGLPLKARRVDFAPVVALVILFLLAGLLENGLHPVFNHEVHTWVRSLGERYTDVSR